MNALPYKNPQTPGAVIDDLIANYGFRKVLLAVAARLFRKQHPPDSAEFPTLRAQPGVDRLTAHLRKDLGLPPETQHQIHIDPIMLRRH